MENLNIINNLDVRKEIEEMLDVQTIWRDHHVVRLHCEGYNNTEIANIVHITPATVSKILSSDFAQEKIKELNNVEDEKVRRIGAKIDILTDLSLDHYIDVLGNQTMPVDAKTDISKHIMNDLSGLRVPTRYEGVHAVTTLEEIEEFKRRGRKEIERVGSVVKLVPGEDYEQVEESEDV